MKKQLIACNLLLAILCLNAKAEENLPAICLINGSSSNDSLLFSEHKTVEKSSITYYTRKKTKSGRKSFAKKFGPLEMGFRVNPFGLTGSSVAVNIDVLHSYKILTSSPKNMGDFQQAFKPHPDYNLIDPRIVKLFNGHLLQGDILQNLHSAVDSE